MAKDPTGGGVALTRKQAAVLTALATGEPLTPDEVKRRVRASRACEFAPNDFGFPRQTLWSLERRGLARHERTSDGADWLITDAGRAAREGR